MDTSNILSLLSVIATFGAVLVALWLPFYQEGRKNKNINSLIEIEHRDNMNAIGEVLEKKREDFNQAFITTGISEDHFLLAFQAGTLKDKLNLSNWNDYKNNLAISNASEYIKLQVENNAIIELMDWAKKTKSNLETGFNNEQRSIMEGEFFKAKLASFKK